MQTSVSAADRSARGATEPTTYSRWVASQGIPTITGFHIEDLHAISLAPWEMKGVPGAIVHLEGAVEAHTDAHVCEIPPAGHLQPQKHLYEELVFILSGRGATTVWYDETTKQTFEWHRGSLFTLPINAWHQHFNLSGDEPARYYAVTNAPLVMDLFHNLNFVFGDPFRFDDRFDGSQGSFNGQGEFVALRTWQTNFVGDVGAFELEDQPRRGGGRNMHFELGHASMMAHTSEFPVGTYKKAHRHGPGANVVIVSGEGYSLYWRDGEAKQRLNWRPGSVFVPPNMVWHQHFNAGPMPARYLALRWNSRRFPLLSMADGQDESVKEGGNQIEYEDEDPAVRELFAEECARHGVAPDMDRIFARSR